MFGPLASETCGFGWKKCHYQHQPCLFYTGQIKSSPEDGDYLTNVFLIFFKDVVSTKRFWGSVESIPSFTWSFFTRTSPNVLCLFCSTTSRMNVWAIQPVLQSATSSFCNLTLTAIYHGVACCNWRRYTSSTFHNSHWKMIVLHKQTCLLGQ